MSEYGGQQLTRAPFHHAGAESLHIHPQLALKPICYLLQRLWPETPTHHHRHVHRVSHIINILDYFKAEEKTQRWPGQMQTASN